MEPTAAATWSGQDVPQVAVYPSMAYSRAVWFIETPVFSDQLHGLLLRPEQGTLIPGSGGLRKLRWALRGRGKRGGLRVIYYWDPAEDLIYLLFLYSKNQQEDLSPAQLKLLSRIVQEELK